MDNTLALYIGLSIFAIIGLGAGFFANRINQAIANLEHLASGKVTDHHTYVPFD